MPSFPEAALQCSCPDSAAINRSSWIFGEAYLIAVAKGLARAFTDFCGSVGSKNTGTLWLQHISRTASIVSWEKFASVIKDNMWYNFG